MSIQSDREHIEYVRTNLNNPLYEMEKPEALKYAVGMGASDTARGIGQLFGKAGEFFGWDGLTDKLKEQDKTLRAILEHPEYGTEAMAAFLSSAIVADPATYVPIVGWISKGKKAKNLWDLTKYSTGSAAIVGGLGYTSEDSPTLLQDADASFTAKKLEQVGLSGALGAVIGAGGGAAADIIQKSRGKGSIFDSNSKKIKDVEKEVIKDTNQKYKPINPVLAKYQTYVGQPLKNIVFNNPGEALGFVAGYNAYSDPDATYKEKITTGLLLSASIKGAKNIKVGDGQSVKEIFGRALINDYGLTPDYIARRQQFRINKNEIGEEFRELVEEINQNLNLSQRKLLYNFMVGDIQDINKLSPDELNLNDKTRDLITKYAQEFVNKGMLSEKVFKQNIDTYLRRSYLRPPVESGRRKYNLLNQIKIIGSEFKARGIEDTVSKKEFNKADSIWQKEGWQIVKENKDGTVVVNRDFTKAERVDLGEIEDASYAIAETGRLFANDIALLRFFDDIAANEKFVLTPNKYKKLPVEERKKYEKVSGGRDKLGRLHGKYVDKNVLNDLRHVTGSSNSKIDSVFEKPFIDGENFKISLDSLQRFWKKTKTSWNVSTHVGNTASNVMLLDFADTKLKYLTQAFREMVINKNSQIHKQAQIDGIFDVDIISKELRNDATQIEKALKALQEDKYGFGIAEKTKQVLNFAKKYSIDKMDDLYQFEDQVFRMAVYMDRLDKGFSQADAALEARKWFIDYDINAPLIKQLKRTTVPFISYTYRVIPLLAESAILRPHKFAKWAVFGHVLNEGASYYLDDKEGEALNRHTMREQYNKKLFGSTPLIGDVMPYTNFRLPYVDDAGNSYYFDASRWIPGGDIFEQKETDIGIPFVPRPLQPGGIYVDFISNFIFRKDLFSGQDLDELGVDLTGEFGEDFLNIGKHFFTKIPPNMPFIPGTFAYKKYEQAKSKKEGTIDGEYIVDSSFKPSQTLFEEYPFLALAYGLGIKLRPIDPNTSNKSHEFQYNKEMQELLAQRNRIDKDFSRYGTAKFKSVEERDKELNNIDAKILRLNAERDAYYIKFIELATKKGKADEVKRIKKITGGPIDKENPVEDVKEVSADRIDPLTGEPYSFVGLTETEKQMRRFGLMD